MGSLSNLYISQSFISLIHLGSNNTASATLTELEDGLGNGVGISVNTNGDLKVDGILSASIITELSQSIKSINGVTGSYATTGSNTFVGNQTITGDVQINGTLSATEIHTLIESSSIIFSSGSNILGDSVSDIQTLNGTIIMSGSGQLTGSISITGTITSPTITSINSQLTNIELFTQSADIRLDNLESKSASVDISVSSLNQFSASQITKDATLQTVTASLQQQLTNIGGQSGSWITETESASFLITASVSSSTLTFTKGDASQFSLTVGRGDGFPYTGSAIISGSLNVTGSINLQSSSFSGSVVDNITDTFTSSSKVFHIVTLSNTEYTNLSVKDSNTLYLIVN